MPKRLKTKPPATGKGGRAPSISAAAPSIVAGQLREIARLARGVGRNPDSASVHGLRVAVRRFRVSLELFGSRDLLPLEQRAKALQDALGAVRNLQVESEWLASLAQKHPEIRPLLGGNRDLKRERSLALARAVVPWQRPGAEERKVEEALNATPGRLGGAGLRRALQERLRKVDRRLRGLKLEKPEKTHRVRIQIKKLRYAAELVGPAVEKRKDSETLLAALRDLQGRLGDLHDAMEWEAEWSAAAERLSGARRKGARHLAKEAAERQAQATAKVQKAIKRWRKSRLARRLEAPA